jgi:sortase A
VALIKIPRIGLDQVVVEGTSPEDLKQGPGHLRAAPLPGEFGNAVIAARRTTYGGPFRNLDLLRLGDVVRVTTGQGAFFYTVAAVRHMSPGKADALMATLDTRLTLVSSDPAFAPSGRLVVVAKLAAGMAAPVDVANRPSLPASISELGLSGDPMGLVFALLGGQLLIGAVWLTIHQARRWPLALTLMLATPTLLALAILTFSNADRLLPGTL